jgi:hypothetical protein
MSNHVERFYAALAVLAAHGDIKQRLIRAFEDHLGAIERDELPIAVKERFADMKSIMTGVEPLNGEGHVRATVRKMSIPEADHCARLMIDLYADMLRFGEEKEAAPGKAEERPVLPPFLVKSG